MFNFLAVNTTVKSSTLSPSVTRSTSTLSTQTPKTTSIRNALSVATTNSSRPTNKVSFRERLKLMSTKDPTKEQLLSSVKQEQSKDTISENVTILPSTTTELKTIDSVSESENDNTNTDPSSSKSEAPWSKLKKAAIVSEPAVVPSTSNSSIQTSNKENGDKEDGDKKPSLKPKPNLVLTRKTKHYR